VPAISKIRFTNVVYENGGKRYNDDIFEFDGYNGAVLLENGGGKTVFIQTALQAILPHVELAERKIKNTLSLEESPCHIAIEWILNERPRRYALTAVTLYLTSAGLDSYKYVYEYGAGDRHAIEEMPFTKNMAEGKSRPASRGEISDYYQHMQQQSVHANLFKTIKEYHQYIEENFHIIPSEWQSIARINSAEGDVDSFFDGCKTTSQLVDQLLIPVVEDAMAGNGTEDFVEIFEKQREHFKKHKQLRARIEESKKVSEGITGYVRYFAVYHGVQTELLEKKHEAKAVYNLAKSEKSNIQEQLSDNENSQKKWQSKDEEHRRKQSSYELAMLEKKLEHAKQEYEKVQEKYGNTIEVLKIKEQELRNLEIAEAKKKIQELEEMIVLYENQLLRLESDQQVQDLYQELETNSAQLKGYFMQEEEKLEREKTFLIDQKIRYEEDYRQAEEKLEILQNENLVLEKDKAVQNSTIAHAERDMDVISKEILSNPIHEKIEEEQPKWRARSEELEKQRTFYRKSLSQLEDEKKSLHKTMPELYHQIEELRAKEISKKHDCSIMETAHDKLLERLKETRGDWRFYKSLYEKQQTICAYLEEKVEKTRIEREKQLLEERLAHRLQDDYGTHEHFTVEPLLDQWLHRWSQHFYLLETGSQYIKRAADTFGKKVEEIYEDYPFWAQAVITSKGEVEKLYQRLGEQIDKLTHPVLVLSDEEAKEIVCGAEITKIRYVFPDHWRTNIDSVQFELWKKQIEIVGQNATAQRQNKENELEKWTRFLADTNYYYEQFPYESHQLLKKELREIGQQLETMRGFLQSQEERNKIVEEEISQFIMKLQQFEQESMSLGHKIQRAQEYFNKKNLKKNTMIAQQETEEKLLKKISEIQRNKDKTKRQKDILDNIKADIQDKIGCLARLKDDSLYKEVYLARAISTNSTRKSLEVHRQNLKDQLSEKQKGRQEIEFVLKSHGDQKDEQVKRLDRIRKKSGKYVLDETLIFPLDGEKDIEQLTEQINNLEAVMNELQPLLTKVEDQYKKNLNTYELRTEDFYRVFEEIMSITKSLPEVKAELQQEKEELSQQQGYLKTREKHLKEEAEQVENALRELEAKHERYVFLTAEIKEKVISMEMQQEFPYKRKQLIADMVKDLEKLTIKLEEHLKKVEVQKNGFIQYCNSLVQDVRLREMAVAGIQNRKNYEEVLEWQQKMDQRIARTIELVEDDMREHDRQLQQFIQYLHTYLNTIAQELRMIPRNTRVKAEGGWKEIFQFDVPEWSEQEGKEELRKYIDWILSKLESDEFKNDQGNENQGLVKKSIEIWFQTKQLLKNVMKEKTIKVKCRKVTNDGKVIGSLFSWETSNLWSGGEKWSKNMALFLGILNYVADKRQHIIISKKRNRTVIMDNPFGKASSEHVLQPVFFIAEQLGFQIIALTAHAEGKFISDYFPIVYSCKLRQTVGNQSSIVTKEKIVSYAFFQDHDPQALMRLGEQEQLTLF